MQSYVKSDPQNLRNRNAKKFSVSAKIEETPIKNAVNTPKYARVKSNLYFVAWILSGLCFVFLVGNNFSAYLKTLHENSLWFSNIKVTHHSNDSSCLQYLIFKCVLES